MDLKRHIPGLLLLLVTAPAWAASPVVRVVGPEPIVTDVYQQLVERATDLDVRRGAAGEAAPDTLTVAIGARAFREALATPDSRVVGIALTRESYNIVLRETAHAAAHTAIFWEPDPVRQLQLARLVLPGAKRVGILPGAATDDALLAALRAECARLGFVPVFIASDMRKKALPQQLASLLGGTDFLLGIDSADVFSSANAKTILLTAYRNGRPVIGPTGAWVDAGSIASLSGGLPEAVDTLVAWLPQLLAADNLPAPRYADRYTVVTNSQVARSLSIKLPPDERLRSPGGIGGGP